MHFKEVVKGVSSGLSRSKLVIYFVDISKLRKKEGYTQLVLNTLKDLESHLFIKYYGSVVTDTKSDALTWEIRDPEVIY